MIHGVTVKVEKLSKEPVTMPELACALHGFPYKFISPMAHQFYIEFEVMPIGEQVDDVELTDYLTTKGIIISSLIPSVL